MILAAGGVALIGSFVNVFGSGRFGISGWGSGLFPLFTLIPLYAVLMAVHVALTRFASVNLPERVLELTWEQIHLVLGFFAALMALAWLISGTRFQAGFWLVFLGAAAALVGAVMLQKERSTGALG